jgi:phenylpyruvate tautomerase PptA (4-oxalocrotonate tautomerase family)
MSSIPASSTHCSILKTSGHAVSFNSILLSFFGPAGRSEKYTIIELSMFEGRSVETKKALIRLLFKRFERILNISPPDVEITIFETPQHNWGFRGLPGDEYTLNYKIEVSSEKLWERRLQPQSAEELAA